MVYFRTLQRSAVDRPPSQVRPRRPTAGKLTKPVYVYLMEHRYRGRMSRFSIQIRDPAPRKPPINGWVAVRVFIWTLLLAGAVLWCWSMLAA